MSLRINHNIDSINAHRNLQRNSSRVSKSLQRLSSGMKLNTAGDGPASFVASEQMRAQISSIDQALKNSEASVSMVQTAEGALGELNSMLVGMRQLALHAANEGANDAVMVEADQNEISNMLSAIDRISNTTTFGSRTLLDGSNGVTGIAVGKGLQFVSGDVKTKSSETEGYAVTVKSLSTQASLVGTTALTEEIVKAGETLSITEGGKNATYTTKESDSVESAARNFAAAVENAGLNVKLKLNDNDMIEVKHNAYGSSPSFEALSSSGGVLSENASTFQKASEGKDLVGKINGEAAMGKGKTLTGTDGNENTAGLTVRFHGELTGQTNDDGTIVGNVNVSQNSLGFHIGPGRGHKVNVAIQDTSSDQLGRGVDNDSNFEGLSDVDVRTEEGAQDALIVIDKAISDVTQLRGDLGSFQKNTLEVNIANMRVASENMVAAESSIRDVDMAQELANYTRNNLMIESSTAMLAQANHMPRKVLRLLDD